jgi:hypothetical protein
MIEISNCGLSLKASASNAVGIGSLSGCTEIDMTDFALDCNFSGANLGAVGVLNEGAGNVVMNNGSTDIVLRGRNLSCIGTSGGSLECEATHTRINLYCEGSTVSGIGDKTGGGVVKIANSSVDINFLTGDGWDMGSPEGVLEFSGIKNIKINE